MVYILSSAFEKLRKIRGIRRWRQVMIHTPDRRALNTPKPKRETLNGENREVVDLVWTRS